MTPFTYILELSTDILVVWAKDIDHAISLIKEKIGIGTYAQVCSFGGTDLIEIGKRAVN